MKSIPKTTALARKAVRSQNAGRAVAFFEHLELPGTHPSEAGPAAVVVDGCYGQVETMKELMRIHGGLRSRFTMGGRPRISGKSVQISASRREDGLEGVAWDQMVDEMNAAGWTQERAEKAYYGEFQIYDRRGRGLSPVLGSAIRGRNLLGEDLPRGSVLLIPRLQEWPEMTWDMKTIEDLLGAIYGRGGVYFAEAAVLASTAKRRRPLTKSVKAR